MPFKSGALLRLIYAVIPLIAKKFQKETPKGAKLPEHVSDKRKTTK